MAGEKKEGRGGLKVWLNGRMVGYREESVPILTHSLQYGSGIFEGIRAYGTKGGPAIFRLEDHMRRFLNTAKIHQMELGYGMEELKNAAIEAVKANGLESCYIRPFAFYDDDEIGLATGGKKVSVAIAAVPFGAYFGKGRNEGIRCKTSSWRRISSDLLPVEAKSSGNYINSIMANREAHSAGFDEAILLSHNGYIAEGPGENIFLAENGTLFTPARGSDILMGITRDTLIRLARDNGIAVVEEQLHREMLYSCDEAFFSGTAAELTPIVEVDGIKVGGGKVGDMTKRLAAAYSETVAGNNKTFAHWLTIVK